MNPFASESSHRINIPLLPRSFYFLRHGETDWNLQQRIQGWTDIPLNETGRKQAKAAASLFISHKIDLIVTSPLLRAKETAEIVNAILNKPLHIEQDIRERGFGEIEGLTYEEMQGHRERMKAENRPLEGTGYPCPENGEPYEAFSNRSVQAMARRLTEYPNMNVLFVSHGGVYRALKRGLFGEVEPSPNAAPFYFEKAEQGWKQSPLV